YVAGLSTAASRTPQREPPAPAPAPAASRPRTGAGQPGAPTVPPRRPSAQRLAATDRPRRDPRADDDLAQELGALSGLPVPPPIALAEPELAPGPAPSAAAAGAPTPAGAHPLAASLPQAPFPG